MKNTILLNAKETILNMGWQIVHESNDYEYFYCYNPNTQILLYLQQSSYFGLVDISTVHKAQKGHGSGWVYEKNIPEVKQELILQAEKFALNKIALGQEKNITLDEFLKNRKR